MTNNTVYQSGTGINVRGARAAVSGNTVYNNSTGISASGNGLDDANRITVSGNQVHDNSSLGIGASGNVLVSGNSVYGQTNAVGIRLSSGAQATQNVVFDNSEGITAFWYDGYGTIINNNRVYHNSNIGIHVYNDSIVQGNTVYSNSVGIQADPWYYWGAAYPFSGAIINNLVYANTNQGIIINMGSGARVVNNTVYQPVGDAVRVQGGSQNIQLRNNILWVQAGYDINIAADSQTGFNSDYNLFNRSDDPNANVGYWNGNDRDLADWQTASGQDANSLFGDPLFVDMNGADNVLGYTTAGGGYDGGPDDNFYLSSGSPAIDRGDSWAAPATDIDGFPREDDPGTPNLGSPDYAETDLGTSSFTTDGTPQNWRSDNTYFGLNLPFAFPFYTGTYTGVYVSTEGFLHFAGLDSPGDGANSTAKLINNVRIAPLWDELYTYGPGNDIFVDSSVADQVTICWNATNEADGSTVNFAVTLFSDGQIRFDYGDGNTNLTPTIGISAGDGRNFQLSQYNQNASLTNADSVQFTLTPGTTYADIGAYQFRGGGDVTPPTVVGTHRVSLQPAATPARASARYR